MGEKTGAKSSRETVPLTECVQNEPRIPTKKAENATYITRSADLLQAAVLEVMTSPDHGQPVKEICSIGLGREGGLTMSSLYGRKGFLMIIL